jgi:hypothetical protein
MNAAESRGWRAGRRVRHLESDRHEQRVNLDEVLILHSKPFRPDTDYHDFY